MQQLSQPHYITSFDGDASNIISNGYAIDASNILMYSAMMGADNKADWDEVLNTKSEPTA